jgi:hypothetical protein
MPTKSFYTIFIIGLAVFIMNCTKDSPLSPQAIDHASIATSINVNQRGYAAASLDSLIMEVSGDGLQKIKKSLIIDGTRAHAHVQVPTGVDLRMEVTGYQDSTAVLFGANNFKAEKGVTTPVAIKMDFMVPTIILSPPDSSLQRGDRIALHLAARNVVEMSTFGAQVHFDPTKLKVVELEREDDFLKSSAGSVMQIEFSADNNAGTVKAVLGIFPASSGVSGSGNIGKIIFEAIDSDTTDIAIRVDNQQNSDLGLFDKSANLMYSVGLGSRLFIQATVE